MAAAPLVIVQSQADLVSGGSCSCFVVINHAEMESSVIHRELSCTHMGGTDASSDLAGSEDVCSLNFDDFKSHPHALPPKSKGGAPFSPPLPPLDVVWALTVACFLFFFVANVPDAGLDF